MQSQNEPSDCRLPATNTSPPLRALVPSWGSTPPTATDGSSPHRRQRDRQYAQSPSSARRRHQRNACPTPQEQAPESVTTPLAALARNRQLRILPRGSQSKPRPRSSGPRARPRARRKRGRPPSAGARERRTPRGQSLRPWRPAKPAAPRSLMPAPANNQMETILQRRGSLMAGPLHLLKARSASALLPPRPMTARPPPCPPGGSSQQ